MGRSVVVGRVAVCCVCHHVGHVLWCAVLEQTKHAMVLLYGCCWRAGQGVRCLSLLQHRPRGHVWLGNCIEVTPSYTAVAPVARPHQQTVAACRGSVPLACRCAGSSVTGGVTGVPPAKPKLSGRGLCLTHQQTRQADLGPDPDYPTVCDCSPLVKPNERTPDPETCLRSEKLHTEQSCMPHTAAQALAPQTRLHGWTAPCMTKLHGVAVS